MFELPWRKKPGHDYMHNIGRLYDKEKEEDKEQNTEWASTPRAGRRGMGEASGLNAKQFNQAYGGEADRRFWVGESPIDGAGSKSTQLMEEN